jgi:hypothetical protein
MNIPAEHLAEIEEAVASDWWDEYPSKKALPFATKSRFSVTGAPFGRGLRS